jgi:hypothetical protein
MAAVEASMGLPGPLAVETKQTEKPVSLLAYPATYLLIGINVVVFAVMFRFGPVPELFRYRYAGPIWRKRFAADSAGAVVAFADRHVRPRNYFAYCSKHVVSVEPGAVR